MIGSWMYTVAAEDYDYPTHFKCYIIYIDSLKIQVTPRNTLTYVDCKVDR